MVDNLDDTELDRLEDLRRYGYPEFRSYDQQYFQLPPKKSKLIRDWTKWRIEKNEQMITGICNSEKHSCFRTIPLYEKIPDFFKGQSGFYAGQGLKDEFGGEAIGEDDDDYTKHLKEIMDENFFMFGIPRVSLSNVSKRESLDRRASELTTTFPDPELSPELAKMNISSIADPEEDAIEENPESKRKSSDKRGSIHSTKEGDESKDAPMFSIEDLDQRGAVTAL